MDQSAHEEEGQGWLSAARPPRIALVEGVNDASAELVEDFQVTRYELKVLARQYLEDVKESEFEYAAYLQAGSTETKKSRFGIRRLGSIELVLGKDVLAKALAPVEEKWKRTFDDLKVDLATPVKCEKCGKKFYREDVCPVEPVLCHKCLDG